MRMSMSVIFTTSKCGLSSPHFWWWMQRCPSDTLRNWSACSRRAAALAPKARPCRGLAAPSAVAQIEIAVGGDLGGGV
jgi:hypothetical protein